MDNPFPLKVLLRPIVRFCLRHSFGYQFLADSARELFLEEGATMLEESGVEPNVSRLSVLTGINRRLITSTKVATPNAPSNETLLSRVLGQWQHNSSYLTKEKKPRVLSVEGVHSEFQELVASISRDLNPYTVLKELERTDSVERTPQGLKLKKTNFLPQAELQVGFRLAGEDMDDLLQTVEENVMSEKDLPNLHLRTEYTRVRGSKAEEVKNWLLDEGSKFHEKARKYLAALDLDIKPIETQRTGKQLVDEEEIRVVVGTFGRLEKRKP